MNVQKSTVAEIENAPNFAALAAEYAAESSIDGFPPPMAKWGTYKRLEAGGILHVYSAIEDGVLAGLISVLIAELPHYSVSLAICESFFVAKAHRHTLAGLKLLVAAEAKSDEAKTCGLQVIAPFAGRLFELLPRCGYVETNRVFFKRVAHG